MAEAGTSSGQFGLRDMLAIMIRRRWVILAVVAPIALFATIGTMQSTDMLTASTDVLIEGRSAASPQFRVQSVDYDVLMSTATEIAQSMPVAAKAAEALWDTLPSIVAADPDFILPETPRQLRNTLLRYVSCGPVGESNILRLSYNSANRRFALLAVGALTDAYIDYSIESQQNTRAIDYYTDQINMLQVEIDSLMTRRADIYNVAGFMAFRANTTAGINHIKSLEYSYYTTRSTRIGLESRLEAIYDAIDENPDYAPALLVGENQTFLLAKGEYDDALRALNELRVRYQEDSEWVQRQHQLVDDARNKLHEERDAFVTHLEIELQQLWSTEVSLQQAVEEQKDMLIGYPDIERRVESIDLQISTQRDLLESLQMKRGEVRLSAESDLRISNITQLNEPSIKAGVGGGKKMLYLVMALVLALVIGLMAAVFIENQDHRIYDRRDAEQALEVPVLGAISPEKGGKT